MAYNIETNVKTISVHKLNELLKDLPPTDVLMPNAVGNLAIIRDAKCIGFVDFAGIECIEFFDEADAPNQAPE